MNAAEERKRFLHMGADAVTTYPVVYHRYKARYEDEWPASTIYAQQASDDCYIELIDGRPAAEWLADHPEVPAPPRHR